MAENGTGTPLVERLLDAGTLASLSAVPVGDIATAMQGLGYASVFDIIREPRDAFARKLTGALDGLGQQLAWKAYDNAVCYAEQASLVYRRHRLSKGVVPTAGERTGLRSLVEVGPSYAKQFKEDWDNFCRSGALEAIDSPVAYLADIVRFAQALEQHGDLDKITLDQRRPDIFATNGALNGGLVIDRSNTFDPLPVLRIANEVVEAKLQHYLDAQIGGTTPETIEAWFASQHYPFFFPYEPGHQQVEVGLNGALGLLLSRGNEPQPFHPAYHESTGTPVGYAAMAWSGLSPTRQDFLLNAPDVSTDDSIKAFFRYDYGLNVSEVSAPELQYVRTFLAQTGLTGDVLDEVLACGRHTPYVSPNCGEVPPASPARHGAAYVNNDRVATPPLAIHWPESVSEATPLVLENTSVERFIRLGKMARLYQWTGISPSDLDVIVTAAQHAQEPDAASDIAVGSLRLIGAYRYFGNKYGVRADEFAALFADLSPYAATGTLNLFDRTFNDPPLPGRVFVIDDDRSLSDRETKLQLCAGLGLAPDEQEYGRVEKFVLEAHPGDAFVRSLPVVSSFYRLARGAKLFGLECRTYMDLILALWPSDLEMMTSGRLLPSSSGSATRAVSPMEPFDGDALDTLYRIDWISDWLKASGKTAVDFIALLDPDPAAISAEVVRATERTLEIARRIHQGIPATLLTPESIVGLDLPKTDDAGAVIAWNEIFATLFDERTGLVIKVQVLLATSPDVIVRMRVTVALSEVHLANKAEVITGLTDLIASAWRAQCSLLETELAHELGLSPELVVLTLFWIDRSPQDMLEPLLVEPSIGTDWPSQTWLSTLETLKRRAHTVIKVSLSPMALHTFLAKQDWLLGGHIRLVGFVLYKLYRYRQWLNAIVGGGRGGEDDVIRYLAVANSKPESETAEAFAMRCASLLAPLLDWTPGDVHLANWSLPTGVAQNFDQIERLLRLGELSAEIRLPLAELLQLLDINSQSPADDWNSVGNVVMSALRANNVDTADMDAKFDETRRDALVGLYLTEVASSDAGLTGTLLKTHNDLYEYLLLDTQVTQAVQTSRVASAMASVQQYINGILLGMEPGYATWQPRPGEGETWELTEWRDQKSQYPLWAANQQLRYFPELYIDPSLRLGKSRYFEELEQEVNQNRIHLDTVQKAVLTYLAKFEEVANLTLINGYASTDDFANATYYFVGKSRGENKYYWRSVDMSQRPKPVDSEHKGDTLNASAWSDWKPIDLPVSEATIEHTIRPVFFNERLFVTWVNWYPSGMQKGDASSDPGAPGSYQPVVSVNAIYKKYDDSWSPPGIYIDKMLTADQVGDGSPSTPRLKQADFDSYAFYDQHAEPRKLFLGVYVGYVAGDAVDGTKDAYRVMWNVRLDSHFRVEPFWPEDGVVTSIAAPVADDQVQENYARVVCRQFAFSSLNKGRVQFAVAPPGVRTKLLKEEAPPQWNSYGHQLVVACSSQLMIGAGVTDPHKLTLNCTLTSDVGFAVCTLVFKTNFATVTIVIPRDGYYEGEDFNGRLLQGSFIEIPQGAWPGPIDGGTLLSLYEMFFPHKFTDGLFHHFEIETRHLSITEASRKVSLADQRVNVASTNPGFSEKEAMFNFRASDQSSKLVRRNLDSFDVDISDAHGRLVIGYAKGGVALPVSLDGTLFDGAAHAQLEAGTTWSHTVDIGAQTLIPSPVDYPDWKPIGLGKQFQVAYGIEVIEAASGSVLGYAAKYWDVELETYTADRIAPKLSSLEDPKLGRAEFLDFVGSSIEHSDGSPTTKRPPIRMNTLFVQDLISRTNVALEALLAWETQGLPEPLLPGQNPPAVMDFKGANGKYFWELFFHLPFSIANRFHEEQQFADSDRWLQFIFDPNYKGSPPGEDQNTSQRRPYWMVRPLDRINDVAPELSHALRAPIDPDGQASAFPVHYRKAVYFLFIRNLVLRGDWAYRELTPDALNEAKLWYVRALDLLGRRPDVLLSDRWTPTSLGEIVASTNDTLRSLVEAMGETDAGQARRKPSLPRLQLQPFTRDPFLSIDDTAERFFRVPFNRKLVDLWGQLESRLYNLRHNRTIDGKPLQLPIFAPPLDPSALLARFAQGGTSRSGGRLGLTVIPHYRYQTVYAHASQAVETLIQFGQTLLSLVERKEQAEFTELQQSQLWELSQFAIDLQVQMHAIEIASEKALQASKHVVEQRKAYYDDRLQNGGVSVEEVSAAALHMTGRAMEGGAAAAFLAAYCLKAIPNVFGLANGGQDVEGPPEGVGKSIIGAASIMHGVAESLDRAAQYKRRKEEWELQRDQAALDLMQIDEQLKVLEEQRKSTAVQLGQSMLVRDQAEQLHVFLSKRFTGSATYGWLVSQLSTFYYQAYDTTLSMCLALEACWQFEIGDFTARFVEPGRWKDAYRGLTVGEGLKLNLLKMNAAYLNRHERSLVIGKTVSVKALYELEYGAQWPTKWEADRAEGQLKFELPGTLFDADYSGHTLRRIRRVGVSIPAVVGAYQDIRAVLTQTHNAFIDQSGESKSGLRASQQIVVSRGIDDDGLMAESADDRYLPFEGTGADSGWVLEFSEPDGAQKALLESLNDVIVHVVYTARPGSGGAFAARRPLKGVGRP